MERQLESFCEIFKDNRFQQYIGKDDFALNRIRRLSIKLFSRLMAFLNTQPKALQFFILFIPFLIALLVLPSISLAEEGTWKKKTDIPFQIGYSHSTSAVNGKIYVMGGTLSAGQTAVPTVYEYDPATDKWTRKADMPVPTSYFTTTVVDGKIYAIGGTGFNKLLFSFSIGLELQTALDNKEVPESLRQELKNNGISLSANISVSIVTKGQRWLITDKDNERRYAIGYSSTDRQCSVYDTGKMSSFSVQEYDPVKDQWQRRTGMPTARCCLTTSTFNGNIYAIGGQWINLTVSPVEEYDPVKDKWEKKADMPTARDHLSSSAVNGKIYVIGGMDPADRFISTVEEYDPVTDRWTKKADMPTARAIFCTGVVNGKIYAIGGWIGGNTVLPTVEVYDPATDTWAKGVDLSTARSNFSAAVVNDRIYAIGGWGGITGVPLTNVEEYDTGLGIPWIRVANISPQEGRVTGGDPIAILGSGFPPGVSVTVNGKPLTKLKVTDTLITGVTPPGTEGERNIWITAPDLDYSILAGKFIYIPISSIVVRGITPNNGKQAGGDTGSITGSGFLPGATVTIGGALATNVVVTSTLITFTIPPGTEGTKDVVVTNPDGQKGILREGYTYNHFPVIEEIQPDFGGPLAGGTEITITGNNFMPGVVVTIGDNRGQLGLFSLTELRLRTPAGTAGPKDVRVVNPDGQETVLKGGFTYNPPPTISSVTPNMGPLEGDTKIIIIGTGFLPRADVLIGGAEASIRRVSPTKIEAYTPPSAAGAKDVVVQNRDGQEARLRGGFTYNPAPMITRVIPDNGRLAGGTKITIQGNGFLPYAKVLIRIEARTFVLASSIQVMSNTFINAVTPSGEPGRKDVVVRNPDGQEIILSGGFTYNPMPRITEVSPDHGPASGGTKIIIRGADFLPGAKVIVGKRPATTEVVNDSTIEAVTPKNPQGVFDVQVINPDTQVAVKRKGFISVGELAYNYPNPFRAEQGTTFRYVTNESVELIKVQIFNLGGKPVGVVGRYGANEVRWYDPKIHAGLYVYLIEVTLEGRRVKKFKRALEVYK